MSSSENDAEWRGKVISTLKSLNHSDDILWKKLEDLKVSDDKIEARVLEHCIECEKRMSKVETNIENFNSRIGFQNKVIIGLIVAIISGIITMLCKIIVGL